jgi:predicted kinase
MKQVIILVGASGSGKSTWTKDYLHEHPDTIVVSADHYFIQSDGTYEFDGTKLPQAHSECKRKFHDALVRGFNVIVDNTSTRAWERKDYIAEAKRHGYSVWLKVLKIDPTVAAARNVHGVPLEAIKKMNDRIDVPEGFYEV